MRILIPIVFAIGCAAKRSPVPPVHAPPTAEAPADPFGSASEEESEPDISERSETGSAVPGSTMEGSDLLGGDGFPSAGSGAGTRGGYGEVTMEDFFDPDEVWDYRDPAKTQASFEAILNQIDMPVQVQLQVQTQIARTEGLQGLFEDAHARLDDVELGLDEANARTLVHYLLERGRVLNSSGSPDQAKGLFIDAWFNTQTDGKMDVLAIDAAHMVAIAVGDEPEGALEWNYKALEIAEGSDHPKAERWLGSLYNNIGWTHHDLEDYESAIAVFEEAVDWHVGRGSSQESIWIARWAVARTLRSMGQVEIALANQLQIHAERDADNSPDGFVCEELAECLYLMNRLDEAQDYFARAYNMLSQQAWLVANEPERLQRLAELGEVDID